MIQVVLLCALLILAPRPLHGYGEPDASGRPVYQERANHVFLNAVRIAPVQYKSVYMAGYSPSPASILTSYPAVPPLRIEPKLFASSYSHSNDMATNNCFSHNSCNGTDAFVRIGRFYSCSGYMGENIAAGYADPLDTNNQWLCDAVGSACAADKSASDGHRSNIMSDNFRAGGVGYAYLATSTYRHYWTQDFGGTPCAPASTNPIYGGSHRVKTGTTKFIAVYFTAPAVAPSTASVVIGGTSYPLSLDIGTPGQATYAYSRTSGTGCQSYYFTIGSARYPDTGCLVTYGEGSCTSSFDASCTGSSTPAATSSPATPSPATSSVAVATTAAVSTSPFPAATTSSTTTKNTLTTTGGSTTGGGSADPYFIYSNALQDSWTILYNRGVTVLTNAQYNSQTAVKASLTGSGGTNFIMFNRSPAVTNKWRTLQFYAAAGSSGSIKVYFNGYFSQTKAVGPSWQLYTIAFSSLGAPATLGNPAQLVFQNIGSSSMTLYLYNVTFL